MSFLASNQQWLCFINGLETPIIAASTTCQMGGLATTQITLPYSPFLSKLPKNVKITLFSLDLANPRNQTPKLEFDGVVQNISWRKDKSGANTALFLMAHTDGVIWSARKKFAYFLDNAFSIPQMQSVAQDMASRTVSAQNPIFDFVIRTVQTANGDGGLAAQIFLTHQFLQNNGIYDGSINYMDCGALFTLKANQIKAPEQVNPKWSADYLQKFYVKYNVLNKVCRIPIPQAMIEAYNYQASWKIIMNTMSSLQGDINFWNFATYLCDQFNFEVYDYPDPSPVTLSQTDLSIINKKATTDGGLILAEYLMKPKSPFAPIFKCNIIFPDQVLDKSFNKNFLMETTRINSSQMILPPKNAQLAGMAFNFYQGPHFVTNDKTSYFSSFDTGVNNLNPSPLAFLQRSDYENEFGVNSKMVELPDLMLRMDINLQKYQAIQNIVNFQFLLTYTEKVSFSLQVTPDVEVVPGMPVLVLDENGEHMISYCVAREKVWDKNGQSLIQLKLTYARPYDLDTSSLNDIANPFDSNNYPDTYKEDLKLMSQYLGSGYADPALDGYTFVEYVCQLMNLWTNIYDKDTTSVKDYLRAWRTYTLYPDYMKFFKINNASDYDSNNAFNKMPAQLIGAWDLTNSKVAQLPAIQWSWANNGWQNVQYTDKQNTASDETLYGPYYLPTYDELNTPGPIRVSPYAQGIVNCHNRYLMQVGNNIS